MKLPYLSKNDIEAIAGRVIAAYRKLPVVQEQQAMMVFPELLVTDLLKLSTEYHILSPNGRILGLTACGEIGVPIYDDPTRVDYFFLDGNTLLIDKRLIAENANKGHYHFTLVHEACHQIYKMLFPKEYLNPPAQRQLHYCTQPPNVRNGYWEEWRTNMLASALLMPADVVQSNMETFGLGDKVQRLNRVYDPDVYARFQTMAEYMGVSKQALAIRLKQLGRLEADYLQNPYELVDIFPDEEECNV